MIPILFMAEAEPQALMDVNSVDLQDVNFVDLLASGDKSVARAFNNFGIGALSDCISCEVTEERNGEYELEMEYPIIGKHYADLALRCIILAKPNYADNNQAFRIYAITTPIDGVVTVQARHISYDLSGIPVLPFTATSCSAACQGLMDNAAVQNPFTIGTTLGTIADFKADVPASVRSWFGGKEGSLIDVYGGEWAYDNYTCTLKSARGQNRGVVIRYGKNLIDFEQEKNCEEVWTGVLPYWADEEGNLVRANIINLVGNFEYRRILCLDLSMDFEEQPTAAQLTTRAQSYINNNDIGVPKVHITLDWVQISELTDRVDLCDTVKVVFEKIGVETSAKVIRTVWDVLKERYSEIEIGDPKYTITDTITALEQETEKATSSVSTVMLGAIARATAAITGNSGGYVVMRDSDNDGYPDEILIMDTPDVATATKVWRWNQSGLGYSSSGVSGTFGLAMTSQGEIVADYITTGTLSAVAINGVTITGSTIFGNTISVGGLSNASGKINVYSNSGTLTGVVDNSGINFQIAPGQVFNAYRITEGTNGNGIAQMQAVQYLQNGAYYRRGSVVLSEVNESGNYINTRLALQCNRITIYDAATSDARFSVSDTGLLQAVGSYNSTVGYASNVYIDGNGYIRRSTSSSRRYKEGITEDLADLDPEVLYKLPVVRFRFKDDYISEDDERYGKDVIGFIAEDVDELYPIAVRHEDGQAEMWESNYIIPAMMELIKRQKTKIDELEERITRLEARFFDDGR